MFTNTFSVGEYGGDLVFPNIALRLSAPLSVSCSVFQYHGERKHKTGLANAAARASMFGVGKKISNFKEIFTKCEFIKMFYCFFSVKLLEKKCLTINKKKN